MDLGNRIDELIHKTMDAVKAAAERCDVRALQQLTRRSQVLTDLRDRVCDLEAELRELEATTADELEPASVKDTENIPSDQPGECSHQNHARQLIVEITQGMINQNLLTLTEHVHAGRIYQGADMTIETQPGGELFRTDLLSEGNRLRERGAIARFYHNARIHPGDKVVLTEISPNRWSLEKYPPAEKLQHSSGDESDEQI